MAILPSSFFVLLWMFGGFMKWGFYNWPGKNNLFLKDLSYNSIMRLINGLVSRLELD
tara:strand:+ start:100 stop:270 length:171 start_codon:yes stop_codon:yes gene_type:complete